MPTGQTVMSLAGVLLNDEAHTRWPLPELCNWLNQATQAIILAKPSASSQFMVIDLVAGTHQSIPDTGAPRPLRMLDVVCNITGTSPVVRGRSISVVSRNQLDASVPNWHDPTRVRARTEARHVIFDEDVPLEFYTYPPNDGAGKIEAAVSVLPAPVTATGDANDIASYEADTGLKPLYEAPLLDYVLYRAFAKDDLQGAPQRSMAHYARFAEAIGIKIQTEASTSANRKRAEP
jgi:hypothetical protein